MRFVCYNEWYELPDSAGELFREQHNFFYSQVWFENLSRHIPEGHSLVLACVEHATRLYAILPLLKTHRHYYQSLNHRYTCHYSLLMTTAQADSTTVVNCLVEGLCRINVESLLLEPIDDRDPHLHQLRAALLSAGFECETYFRFYNWIYRLHGQSFSDYFSGRPAHLRNTIARKSRKLMREHHYQIQLYAGSEVLARMRDYYAVYQASWKASEQYMDFMNGLVQLSSAQNEARLAVLYVQDRPIAAQLWFIATHHACIFRLAYDEAWKAYSPGSILTAYLMKHVIDTEHVTELDFLNGNEAYKQEWMNERRERLALSCQKRVHSRPQDPSHTQWLRRLWPGR